MYSIDFNDDIAIIGHSGSGDADISDKKPTMKIVKVFHGKTGGGYLTQFYPYTGPVTYLAITQDGDGHFKFIVAEGVNEEGPILSFGDTNMRTRFTCGAREFVTAGANADRRTTSRPLQEDTLTQSSKWRRYSTCRLMS